MASRTRSDVTGDYDVVLLRNDGWTLAAPLRYLKAAYELWSGSWVAAQHRDGYALPVRSYRALRAALRAQTAAGKDCEDGIDEAGWDRAMMR